MTITAEWIESKVGAEYANHSYAAIVDLIYCKVRASMYGCIRVGPLVDIVLEYANLGYFGIFKSISAIHMTGVNVTPIGAEYNVCFELSDDKSLIAIYDHGHHRDGLDIPGFAKPGCIFDPRDAFDLVARNDVIAIGNRISDSKVLNKPWWGDREKSAIGAACMRSLTLKAKLMLWRLIRRGL
jgi:hypothetical protein